MKKIVFKIYDRGADETSLKSGFCLGEALEKICEEYQQQEGGNWQAINVECDDIETDLIAADFVSA